MAHAVPDRDRKLSPLCRYSTPSPSLLWIFSLRLRLSKSSWLLRQRVHSLSNVVILARRLQRWDHLRRICFNGHKSDTFLYCVHISSTVRGLHLLLPPFRAISPRSFIFFKVYLQRISCLRCLHSCRNVIVSPAPAAEAVMKETPSFEVPFFLQWLNSVGEPQFLCAYGC